MALSAGQVIGAREAAFALLEEVGLDNYLFALDPRDDVWEVKVEHAVQDGWASVTLPVEAELLLATRHDHAARERLARSWRARLAP
jgi:hypothetical protein